MHKSSVLLAFLLLIGSLSAGWYNTNYTAKVEINLTNWQCSQSYCQFPIPITLNSSRTNGSNIMVVNAAETAELPFWREDTNWSYAAASGNLWVNASNNTAKIFVYYNSTGQLDKSNINTTFPFGDTFDGADTAKWTLDGTRSYAGGILTMHTTTSNGMLSKTNITLGQTLIFRGKMTDGNFYYVGFGQLTGDVNLGAKFKYSSTRLLGLYNGTSSYNQNADSYYASDTFFIGEIRRNASTMHSWWVNGAKANESGSNLPLSYVIKINSETGNPQISLDWMAIRAAPMNNPTISISSEIARSPIYISISNETPINGTYFNTTSIRLNYTLNLTSPTNTTVRLYIDGVLNKTNTSTTNRTYSFLLNFSQGNHSWYVFAFNTTNAQVNATTQNRTFYVSSVQPANLTLLSPTNNSQNLENITFRLNFNTLYPRNATILLSNGTRLNMTKLNGTTFEYNISDAINYTFNLTACSETNLCSSTGRYNASIFKYNQSTSFSNPEIDILSDNVSTTILTNNYIGNISVVLTYNGTEYATTKNGDTFTTEVFPPLISAASETVYMVWNVSFVDSIYSISWQNSTTIQKSSFADCSAGGNPLLRFYFYDQETPTKRVNSTMDATFLLSGWSGKNVSFNFSTPVENITICTNVPVGNYTINGIMQYTSTGYRNLYYYINNQTAYPNSSILTTNLYNLNTSLSMPSQYLVLKGANQPVDGGYVQILRYYPATNQILTVSMAKTDLNGIGTSYIVPNDVNYQHIVVEKATITYTSGIAVFPCDIGGTLCTTTILITEGVSNPYQSFIGAVGVGCWVNETAAVVYCTSNNPSGTGTSLTLKLWEVGAYGNTLVCTQTISTGSGTVSCSIPDMNKTYLYEGTAEIGSWIDIGRGLINGASVAKFDSSVGLLATAFIVVLFGGIGMIGGLGAAMLSATFGFAIAAMFGFFSIGLIPLAGLILVGLVLAYVLRG